MYVVNKAEKEPTVHRSTASIAIYSAMMAGRYNARIQATSTEPPWPEWPARSPKCTDACVLRVPQAAGGGILLPIARTGGHNNAILKVNSRRLISHTPHVRLEPSLQAHLDPVRSHLDALVAQQRCKGRG